MNSFCCLSLFRSCLSRVFSNRRSPESEVLIPDREILGNFRNSYASRLDSQENSAQILDHTLVLSSPSSSNQPPEKKDQFFPQKNDWNSILIKNKSITSDSWIGSYLSFKVKDYHDWEFRHLWEGRIARYEDGLVQAGFAEIFELIADIFMVRRLILDTSGQFPCKEIVIVYKGYDTKKKFLKWGISMYDTDRKLLFTLCLPSDNLNQNIEILKKEVKFTKQSLREYFFGQEEISSAELAKIMHTQHFSLALPLEEEENPPLLVVEEDEKPSFFRWSMDRIRQGFALFLSPFQWLWGKMKST